MGGGEMGSGVLGYWGVGVLGCWGIGDIGRGERCSPCQGSGDIGRGERCSPCQGMGRSLFPLGCGGQVVWGVCNGLRFLS